MMGKIGLGIGKFMKNEDRSVLRGTLASVLCHSFWGLSFLASRRGLDSAHVFVLLSHRFLFSFLIMHFFRQDIVHYQIIAVSEAKMCFAISDFQLGVDEICTSDEAGNE